jgi:hypothetical protein
MKLAGHVNLLAPLTATANSTATGYPTTNLQDRILSRRTRTEDGTSSLQLDYDLGSAQAVEVLWGVGNNLLDDATARYLGDDDGGFSPAEEDSGVIDAIDLTRTRPVDTRPPEGWPLVYVPATAWSVRYVRMIFDDVSRASGYVSLGHAGAGPLLDLPAFGGPVLRYVPGDGDARLVREWAVSCLVTPAVADNLAVVHRWSVEGRNRLLLIPDPEEPEEYQHRVIWGVAAAESFDQEFPAGYNELCRISFSLREVTY